MRETLESIRDLDAQMLAVDPHEIHSARFLLQETGFETDDLRYPLLMDPSLTVSADYGVAFQMRIHTEISNRPATFIIDKQGVLRYQRRGRTYSDRPKPAEIIAELKKLN